MRPSHEKLKHYALELLLTLFLLFASSATGYIFRRAGFPETNIVIVYLLGVLMTARFTDDFIFGIIASVMATFAFNYLFTAPYYTFAVDDPSYLVTFTVMMISAFATSTLTARVKKSAEERSRYREVSEQEHYRGTLLRAISHDLRTPLSGIMGTSEMIMDMSEKNDPRYALADGIWKDADWLHALVENILNLTRIDDGKLVLQKQPEAAEEIISSTLEHIKKRAPEYDISVEVPDELFFVPMDAKLIIQVLVNLLDNAVKHTPPSKPISIFVKKESSYAVFTVSDSGEGIDEHDLPNIFEMFYTSKQNTSDAKRGVGLGLPICDAIVRAHGGTIFAKNKQDGGAEFTFTLPLEVK